MIKLYPNTNIVTKEGILPLSEIKGERISAIKGYNKIKDFKMNGRQKMNKLELKNGYSITVSGEAKVLTPEGPKLIQDLQPNDYVMHISEGIKVLPKKVQVNWLNNLNNNYMPIKVPSLLTEDLCLWLGMVASKGYFKEDNGVVGFKIISKEMGKLFFDLTFKVFKIEPIIYEEKRTKAKYYYTVSKNVVRFLKQSLGSSAKIKKVPSFLLTAPLEEQLKFIQGLTLDGFVDNKKLIVYGGSSKSFSDFVAIVLRNAGYLIYQQLKTKGDKKYYHTRIQYKTEYAYPFKPLEEGKIVKIEEDCFVRVGPLIKLLKDKKTVMKKSALETKIREDHKVSTREYFVKVKDNSIVTQKNVSFSLERDKGMVINSLLIFE